ncbi:MAG: hypothetical protein AB8H80_17860 [Planctomycetota bacterium]
MRPVVFPVVLALLAAAAPAQDQLVKAALKKIDAVEQALPTLGAGDVRAANKLLLDLKWANKRLKAAYKKTTVHWKDAAKRSQEADAAIRKQAAAKPAPAKPTPGKPAPTQTPPSGSGAGSGSAPPAAGPVIGEQFEKLKQLDKEVRNGFQNLKMLNKSFMGDQYRVRSTTSEISKLKKRLATFPPGDKNVQIVTGNLKQFEDLFAKWQGEYAADKGAAAGLGRQLDEISERYSRGKLPGDLHWPYDLDKLRTWAGRTKVILAQLPKDAEIARQALNNSELKRRAQSVWHRVASDLPRQLQRQVDAVRYACDGAVTEALRSAKFFADIDPSDKHKVTNTVMMEGALERSLERLNDGLEAVTRAATLDQEIPPKEAIDRSAQQKQIEAAIQKLRDLAKSSLADVRLPKPVKLSAEKLAELIQIAETTLAKKKYEVHEIKKLVVTTERQRKEKKEGTVSGTVTGATITTYHYVWDEYRVVTAEKIGDDIWVFHNLLKYYHSSDNVTPQGEWILSRRYQGTQILPANVDK